jgi:hypothetical protein
MNPAIPDGYHPLASGDTAKVAEGCRFSYLPSKNSAKAFFKISSGVDRLCK